MRAAVATAGPEAVAAAAWDYARTFARIGLKPSGEAVAVAERLGDPRGPDVTMPR